MLIAAGEQADGPARPVAVVAAGADLPDAVVAVLKVLIEPLAVMQVQDSQFRLAPGDNMARVVADDVLELAAPVVYQGERGFAVAAVSFVRFVVELAVGDELNPAADAPAAPYPSAPARTLPR